MGYFMAFLSLTISTTIHMPLKSIRITLLICVIIGLFIPSFSQLNEAYVVKSSISGCLNVRSDHDANASSIACIPAGTSITVQASVPFWREITFGNNKNGWVAKKFIEPATSTTPTSGSPTIPANAFLTVHFVDVGQGDAIWIQTFDDGIDGNGIFEGYSIIIDGGPYSSDSANPLLPYMENQGYHGADVEALIVTHPHDDHYSGAETVSRHFTVNHYYDPGYPESQASSSYVSFLKAMKGSNGNPPRAKHIHIGQANFGTLNWGNELKVEVLYSWNGDPQDILGSDSNEENNASIVLRIQYGDHVFLLMGDAEGKDRSDDPATPKFVEKILLDNNAAKLKATVLKIAHHGSETSSTLPFIQAVNPDIVVVQSGRKKFGTRYLPDISTLQRYCTHNPNVKIYRTDQGDEGLSTKAAVDGDNIIIRTNGSGQPQVQVFQHCQPFTGNFCGN
jgi:competence protein ComEC